MLCGLNVSMWTARKLDKDATQSVARDFAARPEAGIYTKRLVAGEALKRVASIVSEARAFYYEHTAPWLDDGLRILPATFFLKMSARQREDGAKFWAAVDDFAMEFPAHVEHARLTLGRLFRAGDYPAQSAVRDLFKFEVFFAPLPTGADFRVHLSETELDAVKARIEERTQSAVAGTVNHCRERAQEVVGRMVERLKAYRPAQGDEKAQGIFRDSLVENVRDVAAVIGALNLTGDPGIEALRARITRELCGYDAEALRKDDLARRVVAKSAEDILRAMEAYTGGAEASVEAMSAAAD